jgi:hypothetical protein
MSAGQPTARLARRRAKRCNQPPPPKNGGGGTKNLREKATRRDNRPKPVEVKTKAR